MEKSPFLIVNFNCPEAKYAKQIANAAKAFGLPGVAPDSNPFFDGGLRHQNHDTGNFPTHEAVLYAQLFQASESFG